LDHLRPDALASGRFGMFERGVPTRGSPVLDALRPSAARLPASRIVTVFQHGANREGLIPLWAGEGDLPTPAFIADVAAKALAAGETFYTLQRGIPALRDALARYHQRLYGRPFSPSNFFVTGGGMQAIQLAMQMTAGPGDEVVVPVPAWPNFVGAIGVNGATAVTVPMQVSATGWRLDLDAYFGAVTDRTKVLILNSPANPTGWTATPEELAAILAFARRRGLWILADEIYNRFWYGADGATPGLAPSFQTIMAPDDKILFAQTFSKNWAMTGWRIGWLQAPVELDQVMENLTQYNTSGVATFMQRGAIAALEDGDPFIASQVDRAFTNRNRVTAALAPFNDITYAPPAGAFYAFFGRAGMTDSLAAAKGLIDTAAVGLAPGSAFGDAGEAFFRLCFLRDPSQIETAMTRITAAWRR
jgi:aspartate/methionine/tyrosine aminotransferase